MLFRNAAWSPAFRRSFPCARRTLFTETVQTLSNVYLDLAIALPYPPTWPAYSSTIILVGVFSRLALLPVFFWARKRERRAEAFVIPYLKAYRLKLEEKARQEVDKANSEAARTYFEKIVKEKLKKRRDELYIKHRCAPWVTMLTPPAFQIPVYVTISAVFFHAARQPTTVLRDETFLSLPSLAHSDPTMTLPIALGLVSLASIETSKWFVPEVQRRRLADQAQKEEAKRARGEITIHPLMHIKGILRGLSVGRIVLAAMAPGTIEIYWLTSATFGLFQNWAMNWNDQRLEVTKKGERSLLPNSQGR